MERTFIPELIALFHALNVFYFKNRECCTLKPCPYPTAKHNMLQMKGKSEINALCLNWQIGTVSSLE